MRSYQNEVINFNFQTHQVRTAIINDEPYFVGKDVCLALGLPNYREKLRHLDEDEKGVSEIMTSSGKQQMVVINEAGLYEIMFSSHKKEAKAFKRWVKSEVLPSIRKTGRYEPKNESKQLVLFTEPNGDTIKIQKLAFDVAMRAKVGTAEYKLVKALKPYLFDQTTPA